MVTIAIFNEHYIPFSPEGIVLGPMLETDGSSSNDDPRLTFFKWEIS